MLNRLFKRPDPKLETTKQVTWYRTRDGQIRCIDPADKLTAKRSVTKFVPKRRR